MRKCGTTSTSRGWLPGTQPKTVHTYKKKKGVGGHFFWYANVNIMWDFSALDSGSCGRVWRNGDIGVHKEWLQTYVAFFQLLSAFKIETLIINVGAPTDLCDILCFINKTSKTHIRLYYSTILGCEVNSNNSYGEIEISSEYLTRKGTKITEPFTHNNRTECVYLSHKVKEYSERTENDCRWKNMLTPWST